MQVLHKPVGYQRGDPSFWVRRKRRCPTDFHSWEVEACSLACWKMLSQDCLESCVKWVANVQSFVAPLPTAPLTRSCFSRAISKWQSELIDISVMLFFDRQGLDLLSPLLAFVVAAAFKGGYPARHRSYRDVSNIVLIFLTPLTT
jgi:hypothetical protein